MRLLHRLWRGRKGVTAIEFALTAPLVLLFIFATIDVSWMMLSSVILENAVRQASRAGITGYVPSGMTRTEFVRSEVNKNLIILDPDKLQFETTIYNTFANIDQPEPYTDTNHNGNHDIGEPYTDSNGNGQWDEDMGVAGEGGGGAIVIYRVTYPYQMMTPMVSRLFPHDGKFDLHSNMVVRNEPF